MQWLQATFANRFNRHRGEHGHLFQGRYKAILVEEGGSMGWVSDFIHLNPVRAHVLPAGQLNEYRHSSYWFLKQPHLRPRWPKLEYVLAAAGGLADTPAGWASYGEYLAWQATEGPLAKSEAYASMSPGWALGGEGFKATLLKDHAIAVSARAWDDQGAKEMRERAWTDMVVWALRALGRGEEELNRGRRSEAWKVAVAVLLKERSQASNLWLARRLKIGRAKYASRLVTAQPQRGAVTELVEQLRGNWAT